MPSRFYDHAQRRVLVLDGAMGTSIFSRHLSVEQDYCGCENCTDILVRTRMTAAAAGLAVTSPLLDREVVRLAMLLPGAFKLRGLSADASTRWLLRALLKGQMPPALVNRPDRVMARPLDDWLIGPGRLFLEDRFDRLREDTLGLWHHTGLEAIRRGLSAGRAGAAHRLWALFALDAWVRAVKAT